ncbi:MAG: YeeE/YedE thiosulfate transporter family protein [Mycobacterium sp.]|nr:YeeE/YedE thiosulfate transporter family protein [Mycobacterium sp.]
MSAALLAALALVFVMGMAVQGGNTCTVVAFDDLLHRRSPERLLAIVYCWVWVAGGLTLLKLTTGFTLGAQLFPITIWSVIGGLTLGIGAVVNGACTVGTVARIGSGEYAYGLTLVGFFLGCVLAPPVFGRTATSHTGSAATTTSVDYPVPALFGLAVVVALTVRRLAAHERESFRDFLHKAWDPRTALMIVAVLFVVVVHVYGAWAYTDLLGDVAKGADKQIGERFALFAALLAGAIRRRADTAGHQADRTPRPAGNPMRPGWDLDGYWILFGTRGFRWYDSAGPTPVAAFRVGGNERVLRDHRDRGDVLAVGVWILDQIPPRLIRQGLCRVQGRSVPLPRAASR